MSVFKVISKNKKASFNYFLEDQFEAGIDLTGSEVKSLRQGKVNIEDAHIDYSNGNIVMFNSHINEYEKANRFNHDPKRPRILLLRKKEMRKIIGKVKIKGYTVVVGSIYFNDKNKVKLEIFVAKGKKLYDKREDLKQKDWNRTQGKLLRSK